MPVSEKTYTFRGTADLGPRMREAFRVFQQRIEADDLDGEELRAVAERYWTLVLRRVHGEKLDNQSALLRLTSELFVAAVESVARDREHETLYREWAEEDVEASEIRAGALRTAADRWREQ